jgi:transglutaminase-like putative cysteine protease
MGSSGDLHKMRRARLLTLSIILVVILSLSGCTSFLSGPTTYIAHPTSVHYTIRYGYYVNCSGPGKYEVTYTCDLPEVLTGNNCPYTLLNTSSYRPGYRADNSVIVWNLNGTTPNRYILGVEANITGDTYLYPDLSGKRAYSLAELQSEAEDYINRYTKVQGNETAAYIDPLNRDIRSIAESVQRNSSTNSLLLAKALFTWLKGHVQYKVHEDEGVRPAAVTLALKTGDCDDLSFLYISLCRSIGIPARFIRGYLISDGTPLQAVPHAWTEVFIGPGNGVGGWIPVECSCLSTDVQTDIEQNFGLEDCYHLRVFQDMGDNESLNATLSSINYLTYGPSQSMEFPVPFAVVSGFQVLASKQLTVQKDGTRSLG